MLMVPDPDVCFNIQAHGSFHTSHGVLALDLDLIVFVSAVIPYSYNVLSRVVVMKNEKEAIER